jgi:HlyD family secretion protein
MADTQRKRPPAPVIAVVLLLLIGGGIWWWWSSTQNSAAAAQSTLTGSIEATEYQVSPAISGRVTKVLVDEGDQVAEGQELVRLDQTTLKLQRDQAQQGVTAAKAALRNVQDDDDSTKADETAAKAKVKQAEAQVKLVEAQIGYTIVKAPHAGTVTSVTTNVGQNASPARTLLTVLDPDSLFARVYVAETEIGNVKVGQTVTVTTDSVTGTFSGTVSYIATSAQFTPNTIQTKDQRVKLVYEVRVRITDSGSSPGQAGALKPGMPVDVALS